MNLTISASANVFWHVPQVRMSCAVDSASPVSESAVIRKEKEFISDSRIDFGRQKNLDRFNKTNSLRGQSIRPGIAARPHFIEASELCDTFIGHFISITFDKDEKVFECALEFKSYPRQARENKLLLIIRNDSQLTIKILVQLFVIGICSRLSP